MFRVTNKGKTPQGIFVIYTKNTCYTKFLLDASTCSMFIIPRLKESHISFLEFNLQALHAKLYKLSRKHTFMENM